MKILKYYNSTILYKSPKNPIFVQLSPIQCTYSNIFIRFFKFFPANTNIYQNSYRVPGANCAVEIALSGRQCSLLCLFAPFPHASTKVSCVGFIIWFPSGRCVVCFSFDQPTVASNSRLSYACILLFPTGTKYPAGSPYFRSQ